jgi:hypothetical protein
MTPAGRGANQGYVHRCAIGAAAARLDMPGLPSRVAPASASRVLTNGKKFLTLLHPRDRFGCVPTGSVRQVWPP